MRRDRDEAKSNDADQPRAAAAFAVAPQQQPQRDPHPVLTRPALLSHVFKFAVCEHKDVKLLYVHSAWEDTAVSYCPWMWERLLRARQATLSRHVYNAKIVQDPPPLEGASIEQHSQHMFNHYVCRVWAFVSYSASIFARLVSPRAIDLTCGQGIDYWAFGRADRRPFWCKRGKLTNAGLKWIGTFAATLTHLDLRGCGVGDASMAHICKLTALHTLRVPCMHEMEHISHLRTLRVLHLSPSWELDAAAMAHACTLPLLEELIVAHCFKVTDNVLHRICGNLTQLRVLDVSWCCQLTDRGFARLENLRSLRVLCLSGCHSVSD